jgi:hypothetical protein
MAEQRAKRIPDWLATDVLVILVPLLAIIVIGIWVGLWSQVGALGGQSARAEKLNTHVNAYPGVFAHAWSLGRLRELDPLHSETQPLHHIGLADCLGCLITAFIG